MEIQGKKKNQHCHTTACEQTLQSFLQVLMSSKFESNVVFFMFMQHESVDQNAQGKKMQEACECYSYHFRVCSMFLWTYTTCPQMNCNHAQIA
jgi:hypothetical protein